MWQPIYQSTNDICQLIAELLRHLQLQRKPRESGDRVASPKNQLKHDKQLKMQLLRPALLFWFACNICARLGTRLCANVWGDRAK